MPDLIPAYRQAGGIQTSSRPAFAEVATRRQARVGTHLKDWIPVFTGNPGFRLSPE